MLNYTYHNRFSFFVTNETGDKVSVKFWDKYLYPNQISLLNEFCDNGFAEFTQDTCELEATEICENYRQILGLPDLYPFEIYIESNGQLNQSSFKYNYGFYDFFPHGNKLPIRRNGPMIMISKWRNLLSSSQFELCEALDKFNKAPESQKTFAYNLSCFGEIKALSKKAGCLLDSYLEAEEVCQPEKIKIELVYDNGQLEVIPTIDIENKAGFTKSFDTFPTIREVYNIQKPNGGRTRVIITEDKHPRLQNLKTNRRIKDPAIIQKMVEHPERFFDDDVTDFSVFYSDRVKEIGLYKPKFYPFVCPYKSVWIPGFTIKDKVEGEKKVLFKTKEELEEFIALKDKSVSNGLPCVEWESTEIPVVDAEQFIETANKQFDNPAQPASKNIGGRVAEVLIIKENAEETEYVADNDHAPGFNHQFSSIENLKAGIQLKNHQVEGVAWLQTLQKDKYTGCLLADDMGLGKTLQLLYFIEWHTKEYNVQKPYLIVAPVSLLENWENEYQRFFSPQNLPITKLYGSVGLTKAFNQKQNQAEADVLQRKHIILTNYETLRIYQATFGLVDFALIALDEAQKIKTPGTLITNVCKALKADFKVAMSGTPVENTLVDLWCIMDFSNPGHLGNAKDFAKTYQTPQGHEDTNLNELGEKLRQQIGIFLKRRLKKDVAKDLPKKVDNERSRIKKVMPKAQLERYLMEIDRAKNMNTTGTERTNVMLQYIWAIRDISDHPYLADNQINNYSSKVLIETSAKLQTTIGLLHDIQAKQEKAIVFADRKETQRLLQKTIHDTFGIEPSIVNGDTPSTKQAEGKVNLSRQQTIDRFQAKDGFNVIVMSPLSAGVGLNVTKANHIIHYTRHWNPAKEEQATDRAYRIGQEKDVYVYYPMAVFPDDRKDADGNRQPSFDETLDGLLQRKKSLATSTLFPSERAEVKVNEMFGSLFGMGGTKAQRSGISIGEADNLNPNLFEALIAALYAKQGYQVTLNPFTNNKGIQVVAESDMGNCLVKVKQTISGIDEDTIEEMVIGSGYYLNKYNQSFQLVIVSNQFFKPTAFACAKNKGIQLVDREGLVKWLALYGVDLQNAREWEDRRGL